MTTWTAASQTAPKLDAEVRRALISVYYAALGREFELRGAPSVLLPPEARPLSLGDALRVLEHRPERQAAVWRLLRGVPVSSRRSPASEAEQAYPAELVELLGRDRVRELDAARRTYRRGASLFAAALTACAEGDQDQFHALLQVVEGDEVKGPGLLAATEQALGQPPSEVLSELERDWELSRTRLQRLEDEVGLAPGTFALDMADAAALLNTRGFAAAGGALTVYPVSTVIRQDTGTLTTTATVTTLVQCRDFAVLRRAVDPQGWQDASDVVQAARYVDDAFTLRPLTPVPPQGEGLPGPLLLEEHAALSWGPDEDRQGSFHNVLQIDLYEVRDRDIEVHFSLSRSISSRMLWDDRAGGILVNEGYLKVRHVTDDRWRVTSRKRLRFSDRTPSRNGQGWQDLGQALNFLAPAALAWWLESETYSMGVTAGGGPSGALAMAV